MHIILPVAVGISLPQVYHLTGDACHCHTPCASCWNRHLAGISNYVCSG